jgi:hypothetical protein
VTRMQFAALPATAVAVLPDPLEDDWLDWVIAAAARHGWLASHARPARTGSGWETAITGRRGAPDVLLAKGGRVFLPELKRNRAHPDRDQRAWLAALGSFGSVWRPRDAVEVERWLADPTRAPESPRTPPAGSVR